MYINAIRKQCPVSITDSTHTQSYMTLQSANLVLLILVEIKLEDGISDFHLWSRRIILFHRVTELKGNRGAICTDVTTPHIKQSYTHVTVEVVERVQNGSGAHPVPYPMGTEDKAAGA